MIKRYKNSLITRETLLLFQNGIQCQAGIEIG